MAKPSEAMAVRMVGRLGKAPEVATTMGGTTVCRLVVVAQAAGPASAPVCARAYITGDLAKRCARGLGEGCLVEVHGRLGNRRCNGGGYPEVIVEDVKLRERAVATSAA